MSFLAKIALDFSKKAREKRAKIFNELFTIDENTKILDLGSEDGSNIYAVLRETKAQPKNIYIADIDADAVNRGSQKYGFSPVIIDESKPLPFPDQFFDIVYCSSVIEHVTIPKDDVWQCYSGKKFRTESIQRQRDFAEEIRRLGKQYFVQTPYKYFPVESHSWLPLVSLLPRPALVPTLQLTNTFWVKKTAPDWYLFSKTYMKELFYDADILEEKSYGFTKSIMALRIHSSPNRN